jgi:hypothetical protein
MWLTPYRRDLMPEKQREKITGAKSSENTIMTVTSLKCPSEELYTKDICCKLGNIQTTQLMTSAFLFLVCM